MYRLATRSAFGLIAAAILFAAPSAAQAQYVAASPSVGIAVGGPNFGVNLGFGQPVVQPVPYPVYAGYPVYAPRPVVPPYWGPYYNNRPHYGPAQGYYHNGYYNHNHLYHNNGYRR